MAAPLQRVFLSSTSKDLAPYRQKVYEAIHKVDGYHCVRMEDFGARSWAADDFCRAKVVGCDLFVGILGHVHGSAPKGSPQSYTEREYDAAAGKPRLMFLAPDDFPVPANCLEPATKQALQKAFRARVSRSEVRDGNFRTPDELAIAVVAAIANVAARVSRSEVRDGNFRSPDELATAVVAAIANVAGPSPPAPQYLHAVHPYPLQANFTGRLQERRLLTDWLTSGPEPLLALTAIGGMGKSALTWVWTRDDLPGLPAGARPEGVFWWSFYEREARFSSFLRHALQYASGGQSTPASDWDCLLALLDHLRRRRLLLVLDGFERELRAYASLSAAYQGDAVKEDPRGDYRTCTNPHAAAFLRRFCALSAPSRVLLTSRLLPRELDDLAGARHQDLTALDPDDAVAFFRAQGVRRGASAEIRTACATYGYHPLYLRLLAGLVAKDPRRPGDIQVASRYHIDRPDLLQLSYDALDQPKRDLLSQIAAFRSPMSYDAVLIFNPFPTEPPFQAALTDLLDRGLILFDPNHDPARYDLHPVVRQYAYDRLTDKDGAHTRLRAYFAKVPAPEEPQSLDDLMPVIELYHHTVRTGRYDEAFELYRDRLTRPLYFRFGAYQTCLELLRTLFPDGEGRLPRLTRERDQSWVLNDLAITHNMLGQPRQGAALLETKIAINEKAEDNRALASGLHSLEAAQLLLGQLDGAGRNLHRSIDLCREIHDQFRQAIGHHELGRLLARCGAFDHAATELETALAHWTQTRDRQGECLVWAYRAQRAILMADPQAALAAAREARTLADAEHLERDIIRAEYLLGAALTHVSPPEAEPHLTDALTRCRRINMVDHEPSILLAWARWHRVTGNPAQARRDAEEALLLADRGEFRLDQADIHNFLALLALDSGDLPIARRHAEIARERAFCDGPPHAYQPALDEAGRLLALISTP